MNYQRGEKRAYYCWECQGYHLTKKKATYIREAHIAHKGIFITLSTGIKKFVELPISIRVSEDIENYHLSGLLVMWPTLDLIMDHKGNFFNSEELYEG